MLSRQQIHNANGKNIHYTPRAYWISWVCWGWEICQADKSNPLFTIQDFTSIKIAGVNPPYISLPFPPEEGDNSFKNDHLPQIHILQ